MDLRRKDNESPLQYHKRLVYGKLVDKTISDIDYSELSEFVYGQQYSSDVARRMMYGSRRTLELLDDEFFSNTCAKDINLLSELDEKLIELKKEKQKFLKRKTDRSQPDLSDHKIIIGEYLKPEINPSFVSQLEDAEIIPSYGYFVNRGLSDAVKRLVRDSGLGAKIYVERLPFASGTFDLGKQFDIDPISAAFNGGDDCRLLFTIPIGKHDRFRHDFQTFDIIGHLARPEVGAVLVTPEGVELPVTAQGWKK